MAPLEGIYYHHAGGGGGMSRESFAAERARVSNRLETIAARLASPSLLEEELKSLWGEFNTLMEVAGTMQSHSFADEELRQLLETWETAHPLAQDSMVPSIQNAVREAEATNDALPKELQGTHSLSMDDASSVEEYLRNQ